MTFGADVDDLFLAVTVISAKLERARDPEYEENLRRLVPSRQQAHGTRLPDIRRVARDFVRENSGLPPDYMLAICDGLWGTTWREERIAAIWILLFHRETTGAIDWPMLEAWSRDIDNWELVDQLAGITGRLLQTNPRLHPNVRNLASSRIAAQRRLAVVTMIIASRDDSWVPGLTAMIERLQNDDDPLVKKAVTWGQNELAKRKRG